MSASDCRVRLLLSLHLPACDPAAAAVVEEEGYVGLVVEEVAYVRPVAEEPGYAGPVAVAF